MLAAELKASELTSENAVLSALAEFKKSAELHVSTANENSRFGVGAAPKKSGKPTARAFLKGVGQWFKPRDLESSSKAGEARKGTRAAAGAQAGEPRSSAVSRASSLRSAQEAPLDTASGPRLIANYAGTRSFPAPKAPESGTRASVFSPWTPIEPAA